MADATGYNIYVRRDNTTDSVLDSGTVVWDQDNLYLRVHDGTTVGGRAYQFYALGFVEPPPSGYALYINGQSALGNVSEGQTIDFTLYTSDVDEGTLIPYEITGISSDDLSSGTLTGNFTAATQGDTVSVTLANDATTEGSENITFSLPGNGVSVTGTVLDTSPDPTYTLSVSPNTSANEGTTVVFTLDTERVPDGNTIAYTVTGISSDDLSSGSLTGVFTQSSGSNTQSFGLNADITTEGAETMRLTLDNHPTVFKQITINDTSTAVLSPVQGSVAGYAIAHTSASNPFGSGNDGIAKYPFASVSGTFEVGELANLVGNDHYNWSSPSSAFLFGRQGNQTQMYWQFMPFASDTSASFGSGFPEFGGFPSYSPYSYIKQGVTTQSDSVGYYMGGNRELLSPPINEGQKIMGKLPFSSHTSAAVIPGQLANERWWGATHSSTTHGYVAGGVAWAYDVLGPGNPFGALVSRDNIEKHSFSSDSGTAVTGSLNAAILGTGMSSDNAGYVGGGYIYSTSPPTVGVNSIDKSTLKFPFASDTNSTDIGDITSISGFWGQGGASFNSATHGHTGPGIQRLAFSNDTWVSPDSGSNSTTARGYQT